MEVRAFLWKHSQTTVKKRNFYLSGFAVLRARNKQYGLMGCNTVVQRGISVLVEHILLPQSACISRF
jgi:hypothetical protein